MEQDAWADSYNAAISRYSRMNPALLKEIDALQRDIRKLRPFTGKSLDTLRRYFRVGLTWSSNALEGNSLTESETKILLEEGLSVGGKPLRDHFEAVGHAEALEKLFVIHRGKAITEAGIKELHRLFYHRIDEANAGTYRSIRVFLTGSRYPLPPPAKVSALMKAFARRTAANRKKLHPVECAALAHKDFVFIHPFVDGNGRVGRLLMNLVLLQEGYLPAVIAPILRPRYIALLEAAHEDDAGFQDFIGESLRETQRDYLRIFG
jgi:Fic family protein